MWSSCKCRHLRTHGPKYRHLYDHSNCAIQMIIQIVHFCSHVKTVTVCFIGLRDVTEILPIVTFKRYLIINDKSLPHKQRWSFTWLLIFKIKFSSEPPTRWLTRRAEITPVIGSAQGGGGGGGSRWDHVNQPIKRNGFDWRRSVVVLSTALMGSLCYITMKSSSLNKSCPYELINDCGGSCCSWIARKP